MKVAALIPAHNESLTIREIVERAAAHVETVLVMDDGSSDGTAEALAGLPARVVRGAEQRGKGARLVEGLDLLAREGFDHAITLDADGQHDPEAIPAFLEAAARQPGALVIGDRSGDMAAMPGNRRHGIRFGNFFIGWACKQTIPDAQCGMRAYPLSMWRRLRIPKRRTEGFLLETAVLLYAAENGVTFAFVPIAARYEGFVKRPSHFHPIYDFLRLFGMVARFLISRGLRPAGLPIALGLGSRAE